MQPPDTLGRPSEEIAEDSEDKIVCIRRVSYGISASSGHITGTAVGLFPEPRAPCCGKTAAMPLLLVLRSASPASAAPYAAPGGFLPWSCTLSILRRQASTCRQSETATPTGIQP
tara:strand:+ start:5154 stop:5498 length:345 start_codon:yes stop_codon:yes gene_type:complete